MKILHVTEYCHASSIGGTERYILDLVHGLESSDIHSVIGWITPGAATGELVADNIRILRLPAPKMRVDEPLAEFARVAEQTLEREKPDLVHFHTFGLTEASLAGQARARGIPYLFTYHSPAWTCRRDTLLLYGKAPCDGEVRAWRCSACQCDERLGKGLLVRQAATLVGVMAGWAMLPARASSLRRRTAFYYDTLRFGRELREFLKHCRRVISCCDWSDPVLLKNGAPEKSLRKLPQGVSGQFVAAVNKLEAEDPLAANGHFTVGCVGRLSPVKGIHIVAEAFTRMQHPEARLRIVGWEPENASNPYLAGLGMLAAKDERITLVPKTNLNEAVQEYRKLSLLAVPSVWMETGPLTLMEASAAGVPVYGSNRVGQLKLLRERGRVIEPNTAESWHQALEAAYDRYKEGLWPVERKRARGSGAMRTMDTVSSEMVEIYREALNLSVVGKAQDPRPE